MTENYVLLAAVAAWTVVQLARIIAADAHKRRTARQPNTVAPKAGDRL